MPRGLVHWKKAIPKPFESVFLQVLSGSAELKHLMKTQREFHTLPRWGCIDPSLRRNLFSFNSVGRRCSHPHGHVNRTGEAESDITTYGNTSYETWCVPLTSGA